MATQQKIASANAAAEDTLGTLWTLTRGESTACCVLVKVSNGLELRVLMDAFLLRTEKRQSHQDAFELAERWRLRMRDRGWVSPRKLASA